MIDILLGPLRDKLQEMIESLVIYMQVILTTRPEGLSIATEVLYGISWGYAETLAVSVCVLVLFIAMFRHEYFVNFVHALVLVVVLSALGFVWYQIGRGLEGFESFLSDQANFYTPPSEEGKSASDLFIVPQFDNLIADMLAVAMLVFAIWPLSLMYTLFDVVRIALIVLFPMAVALTPLGPRSKKFFQIVFATLLVTMVFGRPVGVLALELGQWARYQFGDDESPWENLTYTALSIALVYVFVATVTYASYKSPEVVRSLVKGRTEVSGDVKAKLQPGQTVDARTFKTEINNVMPMQVNASNNSATKNVINKGRDAAVDAGAIAMVTYATVHGGKVGGMAAKAVSTPIASKLKSKPPEAQPERKEP